ncbi:MAG: hypothetical protein ACRD0P_38675 [Stackebrandtia sp.]
MNRIWFDKRPAYLRDVVGWWDWHTPRLSRWLPWVCRECRLGGGHHKMNCPVGRELATRQPVLWRTAVISGLCLIVTVAFGFGLGAARHWWEPGTPMWLTVWFTGIVLCGLLPFAAARLLRDWWMPKR